VEFFEAPAFTRHLGAYLDDAGLLALQLFLIDHPEAGKVMPGTGGFRKLRWGDETRGKGKRGGLRVIYFFLSEEHQVWLFTLYGKDEADDLTPTQKTQLRAAIDAERRTRQARRGQRRRR
jgi:mRNA-degrading endonuclease RelE of RelBE toxin-antitoxin system